VTEKQAGEKSAFLSVSQTAKMLGISVSGVYRKTKEPGFPEPVRMGPKRTVFARDELDAWIISQKECSRGFAAAPTGAKRPGCPTEPQRNAFAAAAMTGLLANPETAEKRNPDRAATLAREAFALADAMVTESHNVVGKGRCAALYRAASSDRRERP
jgi:predicted DNA-binding transcriptional regulator AlpA